MSDDEEEEIGELREENEELKEVLETAILWRRAERRGDSLEADRMRKDFDSKIRALPSWLRLELPEID